tara:strand:+ start:4659 stop:6632 length:1974 start_codon:yes stop_codon:yes gene_type:complete
LQQVDLISIELREARREIRSIRESQQRISVRITIYWAIVAIVFFVVGMATAARGQEAGRLGVPFDAARVALADATQQPLAPLMRYIWVHRDDDLQVKQVQTVLDMSLSRSSVPVVSRVIPVPGKMGFLVVADFAQLGAGNTKNISILNTTWEKLSEDEPYFLQNGVELKVAEFTQTLEALVGGIRVKVGTTTIQVLDRGTRLAIIDVVDERWLQVQVGTRVGFVDKNQKGVKVATQSKKAKQFVRPLGTHTGIESRLLHELCQTQVPIIRGDWFIRKAASNLEGALYYEFRGIEPAPEGSGISDFDHFLSTFAGVTVGSVSRLQSDKKVAMFRSQVTGKSRATVVFSGPQSDVTKNQGLIAYTQDQADGETEADSDPILNLLRSKYRGIELIMEMQNGHLIYVLFTGDLNGDGVFDPALGEGKLVRVVPPEIASDHLSPPPHTAQLQPPISCMRCHARQQDGNQMDGWQPLRNDVTKLIDNVDVFGDRAKGGLSIATIDQLARMYSGSMDKPLRRARDDLSETLTRLTGEVDDNETTVVARMHQGIANTYETYWHGDVTPQIAAAELGFPSDSREDSVTLLRQMLPPLPVDGAGIQPEDPRIGAIKADLDITRQQWEQVYADAALRSMKSLLGGILPQKEENDELEKFLDDDDNSSE